MNNMEMHNKEVADLRRQAEELARQRSDETSDDIANLSTEEIREKIRELQINKIELELQNEQLRAARAEREMPKSNNFTKALLSAIPIPVFYKDMDGKYIGCNHEFTKIMGLTSEQIQGKSVFDLWPGEHSETYHEKDLDLMRNPQHQVYDFQIKDKDGKVRPVIYTKDVFYGADDGKVAGIVGAFLDISERDRVEAELRRLSTAIEQSPETVMITDADGVIQYVNPAFETTTGYSCEEAIGKTPSILKSGKHDRAFYQQMWKTLRDGRVWKGRIINKRKDDSIYTAEASIAPVKDNNGIVANYVGIKRDITQELKREEMLHQAQKMDSVGQLAGGVAHDFNNMLGLIMGNAEIAMATMSQHQETYGLLQEIYNAAVRSAKLTRQLLTFARKQTNTPRVLDLNEAVVEIYKMLKRIIGESIDLDWRPGAEIRPVMMDPSQLDQILANLCVNARDSIDTQGTVIVATENCTINASDCVSSPNAVPGEYVRLTVKDTGCGMNQETLENLFEPFFTTKQPGMGTGLGLATVYGIVGQNNGFITVQSTPGHGSEFKVYIPCCQQKISLPETPDSSRPIAKGKETVLVVEDEPAMLDLFVDMLDRLGYKVLKSNSPSEAIDKAKAMLDEGGIDLLLSDVVMPEMDGQTLANNIQTLYPNVRCVFMSGYAADVIARQGVLDSEVHFLQKPVSIGKLSEKIREVLDDNLIKNDEPKKSS